MISSFGTGTFNRAVTAAFIGIGLLPAAQAAAQTQQQLTRCVNQPNIYSKDQQIAGCTAAILSGRQSKQNLATSYFNRGITYIDKSDYDSAIADLTQAIQLSPNMAEAYDSRGDAYLNKGDDDRAIADLNKSIQLDPKSSLPYHNRALVYVRRGEYDRAIAGFSQAIQLNPKLVDHFYDRGSTYLLVGATSKALVDLTQGNALDPKNTDTILMLEIALKRSNLPSRLAQTTLGVDMTKWPAPIIRLYLGQLTPEAVRVAAADPDAKTETDQVCEANFFLGELALQRGDKDDAIRLFQLAAADCPKSSVEYTAIANAELKALDVSPK
jgi:lipoprotein NlpI